MNIFYQRSLSMTHFKKKLKVDSNVNTPKLNLVLLSQEKNRNQTTQNSQDSHNTSYGKHSDRTHLYVQPHSISATLSHIFQGNKHRKSQHHAPGITNKNVLRKTSHVRVIRPPLPAIRGI